MEEKNLVLDVEESPSSVGKWIIFAIQHILAMFVACITVPFIINNAFGYHVLSYSTTIISAGIGTIIYLFVTKFKSPVFLSSSFSYLAPMISALGIGAGTGIVGETIVAASGFQTLVFGMIMVGLVYVVVALIIKLIGTKWLDRLLPPVVIGPIIMVIGLSLAGSAVGNVSAYTNGSYSLWAILTALVTIIVTAIVSHYAKGTLKLIPFVIGILAGCVFACIISGFSYINDAPETMRLIEFRTIFDNMRDELPWKGVVSFFTTKSSADLDIVGPYKAPSFLKIIGQSFILFAPVAFVTICEHIGDHKNLGNIIDRDLLNGEPGLTRTLIGDGVASAVSGCLCGAANTTYGENVAVVGVSRIASTKVVLLAAIIAIVLGFCTPLMCIVAAIPFCVIGGASLILYGFIAASGVKMLIKEKVDFSINRNIIIASVILVAGIGGLTITIKDFNITSIAVALILGIVMNAILREKKDDEVKEVETKE